MMHGFIAHHPNLDRDANAPYPLEFAFDASLAWTQLIDSQGLDHATLVSRGYRVSAVSLDLIP